jgi:hypothetical protein
MVGIGIITPLKPFSPLHSPLIIKKKTRSIAFLQCSQAALQAVLCGWCQVAERQAVPAGCVVVSCVAAALC